jgi:ERI1 exoribonuclease 2
MHYAVIDEEFCKVVRGARTREYNLKNEIIQIGIVLLDESYEVVDKFSAYVKPEHGYVDGFIRNLTGINQYIVSKGELLEDVLEKIKEWLPEETTMVSWSMHDRRQLLAETKVKNIDTEWLQDMFDTWTDCQAEFSKKIDSRKDYRLEEALNLSGVISEGNYHDGLSDAYNTASLFRKLRTEENFKLSQNYIRADEKTEVITYSLANLLNGLVIA